MTASLSTHPPFLLPRLSTPLRWGSGGRGSVASLQHAPREDCVLLNEGMKDVIFVFHTAHGRVPFLSLATLT